MILHTPMNYGMIVDVQNCSYRSTFQNLDGVVCQVIDGQVARIISTDPDDFLQGKYQPGDFIHTR